VLCPFAQIGEYRACRGNELLPAELSRQRPESFSLQDALYAWQLGEPGSGGLVMPIGPFATRGSHSCWWAFPRIAVVDKALRLQVAF